jgi:hypothetical protein
LKMHFGVFKLVYVRTASPNSTSFLPMWRRWCGTNATVAHVRSGLAWKYARCPLAFLSYLYLCSSPGGGWGRGPDARSRCAATQDGPRPSRVLQLHEFHVIDATSAKRHLMGCWTCGAHLDKFKDQKMHFQSW